MAAVLVTWPANVIAPPTGATEPLKPADDGSLLSAGCPRVPLASARWQGVFSAGGLHGLSIWGAGLVGDAVFDPPLQGPFRSVVRPHHLSIGHAGGQLELHTHPDVPGISLEWSGERPRLKLRRSRHPEPGFSTGPVLTSLPDGVMSVAGWGAISLRDHGNRQFIALGEDEAELATGFPPAGFTSPFTVGDPLLQSMFNACLHAAVSSRRTHSDGSFAGLAAGINYGSPPRTYFRDSYWTLQLLLPLDPGLVREQLLLLARGVAVDGSAPSGVITATEAGRQSWLARRAADPQLLADHQEADAWWSDHADSPLYLVLLAGELAAWTGDHDLLLTRVAGSDLATLLRRVLTRQLELSREHGLPLKPWHDRDWADNVYRGGFVTYVCGLYHGALLAGARLFSSHDAAFAAACLSAAARARTAAERLLVHEGRLVEFRPDDGRAVTPRLSLDSLTAVRSGLVTGQTVSGTLRAMESQLQTRNNPAQPWGDWGVMCLHPPYGSDVRRRAKSSFPWRYHNAAAWPYLEGLYAEQLLLHGDPGWRYPLVRWWEYGLALGWPAPVEYHSPPWPPGSIVNGWGAMPAAAMLLGGLGLSPAGPPKTPPWGDCRLEGVTVAGQQTDVNVQDGKVEVSTHG